MELLHRRCCGLDVHKETVVACLRLVSDGKVTTEVRTFQTTTVDLLRLSEWLAANDCTHVAMEATGVYWKPVWHILDDGEFELVLANAAHVKKQLAVQRGVPWTPDEAEQGSFPKGRRCSCLSPLGPINLALAANCWCVRIFHLEPTPRGAIREESPGERRWQRGTRPCRVPRPIYLHCRLIPRLLASAQST